MVFVLFSNNPLMRVLRFPGWEVDVTPASSLDVLLAGRNRVHAGWQLLHHPLYGNYRPHQQPYRSLLLQKSTAYTIQANTQAATQQAKVDLTSLHLVEEALGIYQTTPVLLPHQAPHSFLRDCATIDLELMRLPLAQAGWAELGLEGGLPPFLPATLLPNSGGNCEA